MIREIPNKIYNLLKNLFSLQRFMQDLCALYEHSATATALIQDVDFKIGNFRKSHGYFKKSRSTLYISIELKCNRQTVVNL